MDTAISLRVAERTASRGRDRTQFKSLPGPRAPMPWQTLQAFRRPSEFLLRCHRRYGDAFAVRWVGAPRHVLFSSPRAIQQIFSASDETLSAAGEYAQLLPFLPRRSAMHCDGDAHRRRKQAMGKLFAVADAAAHVDLTARHAAEMACAWPRGKAIAVNRHVAQFAADVAVEMMFGREAACGAASLKSDLIRGMRTYGAILFACSGLGVPWARIGPWSAFQRVVNRVDVLTRQTTSSAAFPGATRTSIAARFAALADEHGIDADSQSANLSTILMASYLALATRVKMAIQLLARRPELQAELRHEADNNRPDDRPYIDATLQEMLRLYPNNPLVPRRAMAEMEIDGHRIQPGDTVAACIFLAHRREQAFDNPHAFRPERFVNRSYSPYEYLPFGGGRRRCPAANLAPRMLKAAITAITSRCLLQAADPRPNPLKMHGIHFGLRRPVKIVSADRPERP